ncbi:MAG: hypothetical protein K0S41_505 [Anaerocolumna sp.]|jgi:predicted nucleotidyltransferase|nr:hypothetical protein [Anaerocolumna sp.]
MKQLLILENICNKLKNDNKMEGILLMGSVAHGTATLLSDLDLLVLGENNKFESEYIDDILVEFIYISNENAIKKLNQNDMDVYHYIGSKILFDKYGNLQRLISLAINKYNNYVLDSTTKRGIYHWLLSTKIKLESAINVNDMLKINYITATNSWKIIEAIWAVNNIPIPPSSTVIRNRSDLIIIPSNDWFEDLFYGEDMTKANTMLYIINWVLPRLEFKN